MSATRQTPLLTKTIAEATAPRLWPGWCGTAAGFHEAVSIVEGVLAGRIPKWVRLAEVAEILRLAAEMERA